MRLNITKVLDRIANQLQKSSMLDEPIKLIYSVMHSNDCIARALALRFVFLSSECFIHFFLYRALAIMAHILADDVEAHLHIRLALDSNDEIEVLAAVKAAKKFIPCSK
jgi:integrator complex subunit 7